MEQTTTGIIKWGIDKVHSEVGFKVKHLMFTNVRGKFKEYDAVIVTTGHDFETAEIDFWVDPSSIDTGSEDRDKQLRDADFFDIKHHKQIVFKGNTYIPIDHDGSYEMHGDLTINGVTKRIKLDVEFGGVIKDPWGNEKAVFSVNGTIHRKDWGLVWNATLETGGVLVSDEVVIHCEVQLFKQS